jgi:GDP-D-mannose dehydratase
MKNTTTNTAEVLNIKKNIMGTISIIFKIKGMRKPQDFILYPITKESTSLKIQSSTRIAILNLEGKGKISQSHQNGAYFVHLQMDKLTDFEFSQTDWQQIVDYIGTTQGDLVGSSVVKSDNSGAKSIFNL